MTVEHRKILWAHLVVRSRFIDLSYSICFLETSKSILGNKKDTTSQKYVILWRFYTSSGGKTGQNPPQMFDVIYILHNSSNRKLTEWIKYIQHARRHQASSCAECYSYKVIKIQLMSLIVTPFYELSLAVLLTVAFQCWLRNDIRLIYFADASSLLLKIQPILGYSYTMPNKILRRNPVRVCSIELNVFKK